MKADFTRDAFDPLKRFTRVLMQQGRVQLDADWNEQAAILLRYTQALAADLIGPHGGPTANLGFQIADSNVPTDFAITPGHYYVDGILCELAPSSQPVPISSIAQQPKQFRIPNSSVASFTSGHSILLSAEGQSTVATIQSVANDVVTVDTDVSGILGAPNPKAYLNFLTYETQPDYPAPPGMTQGSSFQIYLDVWERLVTYVEDDSIREVALNGADTGARAKLVCQVKQMPVGPQQKVECITVDSLRSQLEPLNRGRLIAQAKQTSTSTDPCVIPPDASYRGPENQLYRVEIHTGGTAGSSGPATFKWSRENGSVVFPIVNLATSSGNTTIILESLGRDDRFGLSENDWVEIQDDDYVLQNRAEKLLQVQSIDSGSLSVTLAGTLSSNVGQDKSKHPLLRRWDQTFGDSSQGGLQQQSSDNAAKIVEGSADANWLSLEDGIQIQFQPAPQGSPNVYRTADYWLIPARTASGDIEWPIGTGGPLALPPEGVDHHYAPLAVISVSNKGIAVSNLCQKEFKQLLG